METNGESKPTTESAKSIQAISKDTVHRICSGQVTFSEPLSEYKINKNPIIENRSY